MATFGLVHGGFHGAWCWERLIPELAARGHDAVAMDLPSDDPEATLSDYVAAAVDALAGVEAPLILVGHSMGGLVIPHVARHRPVTRLVFICAMFDNLPEPPPGVAIPEVDRDAFDRNLLTVDGGVTRISPEAAAGAFFPDCDPADVAWAVGRLRPQGHAPATPLVAPWPDVPVSLIVGAEDRGTDYTQRVVAPRVGVEPIELPGGHSPFLARPAALAEVLDRLAGDPVTDP
jgi:pimeloyl-ACP methyl ester carboxylesterase